LDFALLRGVDPDHMEGERGVMRAIADGDARGVHDGLSCLSYLPDPGAFDPDALLENLATAGEWLLAPGLRRLGPAYVDRTVELGYPPRSPWFAWIAPNELASLRAAAATDGAPGHVPARGPARGGDWGALAAEHHAGEPPSTDLGREDAAFFAGRTR
jgi:hypothetical protein